MYLIYSKLSAAESALREQLDKVVSLEAQLQETQARLEATSADAEAAKATLEELQDIRKSVEANLKARETALDELRSQFGAALSNLEVVMVEVRARDILRLICN